MTLFDKASGAMCASLTGHPHIAHQKHDER
jgi:hypothetical protein